jgi:hypothetical protein
LKQKKQKPTAPPRRIKGAVIIKDMQRNLYWEDPHPMCVLSVELKVILNLSAKKKRSTQEDKAEVKEHKGQTRTLNRSSNGNLNNQESSNFAKIQMFSQYEEYKKFQSSHKKAAGKRNRNSDNNYNEYETFYLQSFKHNVLGQKRQKRIPTAEFLGEVTTSGVKRPIIILVDTGSSSTIILKKSINNNLIVKDGKTATEWTTLGGKFFTKKKGTA